MATQRQTYVVIPTFNNERFIYDCILSLNMCGVPSSRIIVVDDGSTDGTRDLAIGRGVVFMPSLEGQLGFARNVNRGIRYALRDPSTEFVVLLNSDTLVTGRWLEAMIEMMDLDPSAGIVGPKSLRFDGETIDTTGHILHYWTGDAENRGAGEKDRCQYDDWSYSHVGGIQFSCALLRRKMIDKIGLLDDRMFLYIEDVDYSIRARLFGWNVRYCFYSTIYHFGGGSEFHHGWWVRRFGLTNRLRLVLKNYQSLRWGIFGFAFCIMAIATSVKNRTFGLIAPYGYALIWNVLHLPVRERVWIQRNRKLDDSEIIRYSARDGRWLK